MSKVVSSSDLLQSLRAKGVRSPDMSRALGTVYACMAGLFGFHVCTSNSVCVREREGEGEGEGDILYIKLLHSFTLCYVLTMCVLYSEREVCSG